MTITTADLRLGQRGKFLGTFQNEWRQRTVEIFEHITDQALVITVGRPFDETQDPVICTEQRTDYESTLQKIADCEKHNRGMYVFE